MDRLFKSPLVKRPLAERVLAGSPLLQSPMPGAVGNVGPARQLSAASKISAASEVSAVNEIKHGAPHDSAGQQLHESERMSQIVAYSSQYLFWVTIVCLSGAILLLQL